MKKVIIIDDDQTLCELLGEMIELFGYSAFLAESMAQARKVYTEHHEEIGFAIIDMNLDDATGDQIFDELMRIDPDFSAVLATGMSSELDEDAFLKKGFLEIINKPYSMDKVHSLLKKYITN